MKSILYRTCQECNRSYARIPLLTCGHFVCPKCYCTLKANRPDQHSNNCGCPACGQNMKRKVSNRI